MNTKLLKILLILVAACCATLQAQAFTSFSTDTLAKPAFQVECHSAPYASNSSQQHYRDTDSQAHHNLEHIQFSWVNFTDFIGQELAVFSYFQAQQIQLLWQVQQDLEQTLEPLQLLLKPRIPESDESPFSLL
ncbi:hypothetical protein [Aliiglaciecola sp. LCG003]|uniref:hypothetical protein n=1 Tax=Aliiglaciecola sp. LCG003 TaxID=3053655 RepID=UPI002573E947|nr:hypothetical protein [Aliiglaciecola sp. LCG003]WJG09029.1 hypothetical protein QR722_17125 [Aliiglaciecola sp. LCG003]